MSQSVASDEPARRDRPRPMIVVEPGRLRLRQYLRDLRHHRDLIQVLALREIRLRYRQTALGVAWVVLQPLFAAGILGFVFGRIARLPTDGIPYFIFTFAGLVAWNGFSTSILRATNSLVSNAGLVSKIFFPRLLLPLSTVLAVLLDFSVGLVVLILMLLTNDLAPDARFLLVPVWFALFVMLAQGIGSFLAAVAVRYRDIPHIAPVILQLFLYASPIAYAVSAVPPRFRTVYSLNPITGLLDGFRWSVFGTPIRSGGYVAYAAALAVVGFVVGALALEKMEHRFPDVI